MSRRLRLLLLIPASMLLAFVLVAAVALYLLLQPERFTAMLQQQARGAGLELNLASPATPALFPRPALELQGLTLNAQGASMPILLAAHGRLALPWRTLFGGPTVISRLEIDSPRVDLDALHDWLDDLPPRPAGTPPRIPRIDAGIDIRNGSVVRGNRLLLGDLSLRAGSLAAGRPFTLGLDANNADGQRFHLQVAATPHADGDALLLNDLALRLAQGKLLSMALRGQARWHGAADASARLEGKLEHANAGSYALSLSLTPADQRNPLLLALKLDGAGNHIDLRLPPLAVASWWEQLADDRPQLSVPPLDGQVQLDHLDTGGVHIEGLSLSAGSAVPPAPASAASTPAATP